MSGSDSPTFFHGQPWSSWIERIGRDKPLSDEEPEAEPSSCVTRLSADDIDLYGFCPERDTFYGVVCEICNAIVKPQALIQHMASRHASGAVNLPPPSIPASKAPVKTPYCKVSKLSKKSQPSPSPSASNNGGNSGATGNTTTTANTNNNSRINHNSVKRTPEQANIQAILATSSPRSPRETPFSIGGSSAATGISVTRGVIPSSPIKSPGNNINSSCAPVVAAAATTTGTTTSNARRKRLKADRGLLKDREYDPDRHCGVWNDETGKPCTRSLTCKAHTVSLRRTVSGRSKSFDKLLAEHRASKEVANRAPQVTLTGTITLASASASASASTSSSFNTNIINTNDNDTPGSPPVLSLPDTYPLPKTKLEEDFVKEEMRLEASLSRSTTTSSLATPMAPISVVLPSLSPIGASSETSTVATLIPVNASATLPVATVPLPLPNAQLPTTVLEGETISDVNTASMTLYSPMTMFNESKSQMIMQIPRSNNSIQSPISRSTYQGQASMPSLVFEDQMENAKQQLANGKRLNNHTIVANAIGRACKKNKHEFESDYSTAIQVEATTTSTPYPHFSEIAWSNCHPEPLAVSRWLRITSTRKQYNFNIH